MNIRLGSSVSATAAQPPTAAERIPATIDAAPNKIKHPKMTIAPWRQFILPVSIIKPTDATAITAATVANRAQERALQPVYCADDNPRTLRISYCGCLCRKRRKHCQHSNEPLISSHKFPAADSLDPMCHSKPPLATSLCSTAAGFPHNPRCDPQTGFIL